MKTYDHTWLIAEWERMGRPEVEYLYCDGQEAPVWMDDKDPVFYDDVLYRIKCKPWINWGHVSDDIIAMATDKCIGTRLFSEKPSMLFVCWDSMNSMSCDVKSHKSFTPGTCAWQDSLVMRPVVISQNVDKRDVFNILNNRMSNY